MRRFSLGGSSEERALNATLTVHSIGLPAVEAANVDRVRVTASLKRGKGERTTASTRFVPLDDVQRRRGDGQRTAPSIRHCLIEETLVLRTMLALLPC